MYCQFCGQEIEDQAVICMHCGRQVAPLKTQVAQSRVQGEVYTPIVGFILSFFIAIAGLIVSIIEYRKAKANGGKTTFAFAGIIISAVSIGISVLSLIFVFSILSAILSQVPSGDLIFTYFFMR